MVNKIFDKQNISQSLSGLEHCDKIKAHGNIKSDVFIEKFKRDIRQKIILKEYTGNDAAYASKTLEISSDTIYSKYICKIAALDLSIDEIRTLSNELNLKDDFSGFCDWVNNHFIEKSKIENDIYTNRYLLEAQILSNLSDDDLTPVQINIHENLLTILRDSMCTKMFKDFSDDKLNNTDRLVLEKLLNLNGIKLADLKIQMVLLNTTLTGNKLMFASSCAAILCEKMKLSSEKILQGYKEMQKTMSSMIRRLDRMAAMAPAPGSYPTSGRDRIRMH